MSAKNETKPDGFSKKLMNLAAEFMKELANSVRSTWKVARIANEMRNEFPEKAKKGEKGWVQFCHEILLRDESTVNAYVRGFRYAEKFSPKMMREEPSLMPPVSLVAELAGVRAERREELHDQLYSGNYSASEFRSLLVSARDPEGDANGPKDRKATTTRPGSKQPRKNGKQDRPNIQAYPREKLPELIPQTVTEAETFPVREWENVNDLTEQVAVMLIDNEQRLDKGWSIVVIPPRAAQEGGK